MSDELDKLSDAELSECFAVEVAEVWKRETPRDGGVRAYSVVGTGAWREIHEGPGCWRPDDLSDFATSADAVLPWLEKTGGTGKYEAWCPTPIITFNRLGVRPEHCGWNIDLGEHNKINRAPTFARSACIALIRAKRGSK